MIRKVSIILMFLSLVAACGSPGFSSARNAHAYLVQPVRSILSAQPASYIGSYEPGVPESYVPLQDFSQAVNYPMNLAPYQSAWGEQFRSGFAAIAHSHRATPFIQISLKGIPLNAVTTGRYDGYLKSYARRVSAFGYAVIIGFAPNTNGSDYSSGLDSANPASWIAAWRHVVRIFRREGADNVTWLWTIEGSGQAVETSREWWPGNSYVTWIGIDGNYSASKSQDNFGKVFGSTITAMRKFSKQPILLSDADFGPTTNYAVQISQLVSNILVHHLLGFIWFDAFARSNQRLEHHPVALATLRRELKYFSSK